MPRAVVDSEALSLGIYCSRFGLALVRRLSVKIISSSGIRFLLGTLIPYSILSDQA